MNFTRLQLNIIALSAALARLNQPVWFNVLQHILQNRSGQQEMRHEEEVRARSVGPRIDGRHPDWDKRSNSALGVRLALALLPEWVRTLLWHSLRERYKEENG